jgi:hypothetical protein
MSSQVKYVIDKTNTLAYPRFDFYLANNLYNYVQFDKKQKDPDFEFVEFNDDTYPIPRLGLKSMNITGRKGINYCMTLDACEFKFKFKGNVVNCIVEKDNEMPITVSHEDKMYNRITLMIRSEKIYPPPPGEVFDNLIRNTINYAEKYMNDCDFDSNKLNIYMNDEGYWEKVITRKKRDMDTIYLPKKDKDLLITDINRFLDPDTKARYDSLGRTHKRVYLFEGLPGSGKTSFIAALASMIDYDIATITFTDKVTDGTLMRLIKNIPEKTFLVLEDIDVLFTDRKKNDGHKNQVTFSGILNSLDGITTKDGFICFMTTNYKNQLDSALLRPGRIDKQLEFKYANKEQIHTMFTKFMADGYTPEKFTEFYDKFKELNVEVTMSLIQEYMFKYLDDPESAIKNVDEIKMLHTTCITDKQGELYT